MLTSLQIEVRGFVCLFVCFSFYSFLHCLYFLQVYFLHVFDIWLVSLMLEMFQECLLIPNYSYLEERL